MQIVHNPEGHRPLVPRMINFNHKDLIKLYFLQNMRKGVLDSVGCDSKDVVTWKKLVTIKNKINNITPGGKSDDAKGLV